MNSYSSLATAHLILRLQPLNRALRAAVENQKIAAARLVPPEATALCVTEDHVQLLLDQIEINQSGTALPGMPALLTADEERAEEDLQAAVTTLHGTLPLQQVERELQLSPFEVEALLLCAAPELDRSYERVFGFILDDLNRRFPCLELLTTLTSASLEEVVGRRALLGPSGKLRRLGILQHFGEAPTQARQEFRLSPSVFQFLTGEETSVLQLFHDRAEVSVPSCPAIPSQISADEFSHLCDGLKKAHISAVGIWGQRQNGTEDLVFAISAELQRPLRRLLTADLERQGADLFAPLLEQLRMAAALDALLWFDTQPTTDPVQERVQQYIADLLPTAPVPVLISGPSPWRPLSLLRAGKYAEFEITDAESLGTANAWSQHFPELEQEEIRNLASRFSLSNADIRCISDFARVRARLAGNGAPDPVRDHVETACQVVTRRASTHFATILHPRRKPEDLVLPGQLRRQVLEVATFFRLRHRVDAEWGFGRLLSGGGLKALFTGEPGTGKTLAAEIIASMLHLPLFKVDLARVVSKWVGETEKNLECAFREAEESHALLFFDEAEALFGKRAEVQHGTDRYANLEVSYLLQRLESSRSLIILASNVREQLDPAFSRRFQVAVHFPKPEYDERLQIWKLAFPASAPCANDLDLEALAQLDMTGAAIVAAARTAALLAADSGSNEITMAHVIQASARQYRREARVLTPVELGAYGALLQGSP